MAYTVVDEIRLHSQAARLESLAAKYEAIINEFRSGSDLESWESTAGNAWRTKRNQVLSEAFSSAQELRSIASSIRAYTANHRYLLEEVIETITGTAD